MRISKVLIEEFVKEKVLAKHNVKATEIEEVLLQDHLLLKSKIGRYTAIGHYQRYLTIIFEYKNGNATVITAYPSSDRQVRYYKKKIR